LIPFALVDLTAGVVGLLGGGLLAGLAALVKARPERDAIVITQAQGALTVQSGVIDTLREEIARLERQLVQVREDHRRERERRFAAEARVRELERGGQ